MECIHFVNESRDSVSLRSKRKDVKLKKKRGGKKEKKTKEKRKRNLLKKSNHGGKEERYVVNASVNTVPGI